MVDQDWNWDGTRTETGNRTGIETGTRAGTGTGTRTEIGTGTGTFLYFICYYYF